MRKIYNASCIYVCVCVRGVGVRGLFRILLWELFHAGRGLFGPPGQLSCSTILAIYGTGSLIIYAYWQWFQTMHYYNN